MGNNKINVFLGFEVDRTIEVHWLPWIKQKIKPICSCSYIISLPSTVPFTTNNKSPRSLLTLTATLVLPKFLVLYSTFSYTSAFENDAYIPNPNTMSGPLLTLIKAYSFPHKISSVSFIPLLALLSSDLWCAWGSFWHTGWRGRCTLGMFLLPDPCSSFQGPVSVSARTLPRQVNGQWRSAVVNR